MPGTTRYSATFDRTYEEEDRVDPSPPPNARRSRSQSWQANSGLDSRPYTPLGGRPPSQRSSSTDNGPSKGPEEHIPTRTVAKTAFKAHNNPFQFVKVGTCPLYRKAEEQLKKVKEVKKPDVLKEEEEEWQSNLDSWKSRRRKMSEDVFRRAEEVKQFEQEGQTSQLAQKKTKTFSEMVESRAHRGRSLSLCLISSPMELQNWEFENRSHKNGSCSTFSGESEENSTVNSEDEGVSLKGLLDKSQDNSPHSNRDSHIENGSDSYNDNVTPNNLHIKPKEGSYIDSGLESISSHRAGDTPDSGSDFSHDSNSSIDCDSPRTGVNILEEFSSKSSQMTTRNDATNGFVKNDYHLNGTDKSENKNFESKSDHHEKSIESENEMYVDDFEELERQSEACSKGVYALNVSTPQKQNTAEGFSVNTLFPLSTVTELPSPEEVKSVVSTLSSDISPVSNIEKNFKEMTNKGAVSAFSTNKEGKGETSFSGNNSPKKESSVNEKITSNAEHQVDALPTEQKVKVKVIRKVKKIKKAKTAELVLPAALDSNKEKSTSKTSTPDSMKNLEKCPIEKLALSGKLDINKSLDQKISSEDNPSIVEISNSEKISAAIVAMGTNTCDCVLNALDSKSAEMPMEKSNVAQKKTVLKSKVIMNNDKHGHCVM